MSDCASEANVYGRCSRGYKCLEVRILRFRGTAPFPQPESRGNRIGGPIARRRHEAGAVAVEGPSRRLTTATGRETERVAPPRAHQARVGKCQPAEEPVTRAVQETAKVTADHARQRELARGCEHRNRECLHVGDAEPLREVRRPERLLVRDDHLGPLRLRHPPAVLEHVADNGEHLPAKRGLLAFACRQERAKVRANGCIAHSPTRCELLERGVRRQHDLVIPSGEPSGQANEWLDVAGATRGEHHDLGHVPDRTRILMGRTGLEPVTSGLSSRRSPS